MIAFLTSALAGTYGKYIIDAAVALLVAGGIWFWLHEHDARVLADQAAAQAATVAAEQVRQAQDNAAAVAADAQAQIARAAAVTHVKTEIAHAPTTQACVDSPAVAAALRSLQPARPSAGAPGNRP